MSFSLDIDLFKKIHQDLSKSFQLFTTLRLHHYPPVELYGTY